MRPPNAKHKRLFAAFGLFFVIAALFNPFFANNVLAASGLHISFPPNDVYKKIEPHVPPEDEYVVQNVHLGTGQIINPTNVSFNALVTFTADNNGGAWFDKNQNGKLDTSDKDDQNAWEVLLSNAMVNDPTTHSDDGEGIHLEVAEDTPANIKHDISLGPEYGQLSAADKDLVMQGHADYFVTRTANIDITKYFLSNPQEIIGNQRVIVANIVIGGLTAGTKYVARIRLDENNATNIAYSQIISFTTAPATTPTQDQGQLTVDGDSPQVPTLVSGLTCDSLLSWHLSDCIVVAMYWLLYYPSSFILSITAKLLDVFVTLSISSHVYGNGTFIKDAWKIMRDLANIFFIFVLLYTAIRIIISKDDYTSIGKLLRDIILTAILINFSLFGVKLLIDVSNVASHVFINGMQNQINAPYEAGTNFATTGVQEVSISSGIMKGMDINNVASSDNLKALSDLNPGGSSSAGLLAVVIIFGIVVNLSAAFMFLTTGLIFVGRIIGLWLALIFAPIAFMSRLLPLLNKIPNMGFSSWMKSLSNQLILAPAFIFMLYLIVLFCNSMFASLFVATASKDFVTKVIIISVPFLIILGLLQAAKMLAQKFASESSNMLQGVFNKLTGAVGGFALGAATGGAALGLRSTVGAWGERTANDDELKKRANKGGFSGAMARARLKVGEKMSTSTFDFRNTSASKKFISAVEKNSGIKLNTDTSGAATRIQNAVNTFGVPKDYINLSTKGGAAAATKAGIEAREKYASQFQMTGTAAREQDAKAKEWATRYRENVTEAQTAARKANMAFNEVKFKADYEAGKDSTYGSKIIYGSKKVLSSSEENKRRYDEMASRTELGDRYVSEADKARQEYEKYRTGVLQARTANNPAYTTGGAFDENKFNQQYAAGGTTQRMVLASIKNNKFDESLFKNAYLKTTDANYKALADQARVARDPKYLDASGTFDENKFRDEYIKEKSTRARKEAIVSLRKKGGDQTKKENPLSFRDKKKAEDALQKANDGLDEINKKLTSIDPNILTQDEAQQKAEVAWKRKELENLLSGVSTISETVNGNVKNHVAEYTDSFGGKYKNIEEAINQAQVKQSATQQQLLAERTNTTKYSNDEAAYTASVASITAQINKTLVDPTMDATKLPEMRTRLAQSQAELQNIQAKVASAKAIEQQLGTELKQAMSIQSEAKSKQKITQKEIDAYKDLFERQDKLLQQRDDSASKLTD